MLIKSVENFRTVCFQDLRICITSRRRIDDSEIWRAVFFYEEGARLKWCREQVNWTMSDWGNDMYTDESRLALEPDDKFLRLWRK